MGVRHALERGRGRFGTLSPVLRCVHGLASVPPNLGRCCRVSSTNSAVVLRIRELHGRRAPGNRAPVTSRGPVAVLLSTGTFGPIGAFCKHLPLHSPPPHRRAPPPHRRGF